MRKFFLLLMIFVCLKTKSDAQNFGIQLNGGLMNYGGDLQKSFYTFKEAKETAGINLIYQLNHFAIRGGFTYGSLEGDDSKSNKNVKRNLSFKSNITEGSLCLEYDILPFDKETKLMPYVFAGIGFYHYNPYTTYDSQKVYLQPLGTEGEGLSIYPDRKMYALTNFETPLGIGVKYKISSNLMLGVEFNSRLIYTDYLDDVSSTFPDETELLKERGQLAVDLAFRSDEIDPSLTYPGEGKYRGNPKHNDNYYSSVITLTYLFSSNSLFGNGSGHKGRAINCPKKVF